MLVARNIHPLEVPFQVPLGPDQLLPRSVFVTLIFDRDLTLIDSGVAGAHLPIFQYIRDAGRDPEEISTLILSHSHPDHIGSAGTIRALTGCTVLASPLEKDWIEDTEKQKRARPVPGFDTLVEGPVTVDGLLEDDQLIELGEETRCRVLATPGHSRGSISLHFAGRQLLFTGDALPCPGDLPIYEDIAVSLRSIDRISGLARDVDTLLSSWEAPIYGRERINQRIEAGRAYLQKIHGAVLQSHDQHRETGMALCRRVAADLGLPPFAVNPLVAAAFMSSLEAAGRIDGAG